mmetsp:Transcript_19286/g.59363  ORF Transcript_19286/g.59363 Transcript_19286/m.59363 type:complete len:87 (+) Transcript_19286:1149-1409(+)
MGLKKSLCVWWLSLDPTASEARQRDERQRDEPHDPRVLRFRSHDSQNSTPQPKFDIARPYAIDLTCDDAHRVLLEVATRLANVACV